MKWNHETEKFFYRVAGVAIHDGRVLLHKDQYEDYWVLPGGSCEFGEDSKTAIKREFQEELNAHIDVKRLLFVNENFFALKNSKCHEIGFYYEVTLEGDSKKLHQMTRFFGHEPFPRLEGYKPSKEIQFEWVEISKLHSRKLRPTFLIEKLKTLSFQTELVIHRDDAAERPI